MDATFITEGPPGNSLLPKISVGKMFYQKILEKKPSKICLINLKNGEEINYKTILEETTKLAKVLKKMGVTKDDYVTIISHNCYEFLISFVASLYVGAKLTLLNPDYSSGELVHFFETYTPKVIFCAENIVDKLSSLRNLLKDTEFVLIDSENPKEDTKLLQNLLKSDTQDQIRFLEENIDPDTDAALILSSSGTTGLPKSVMLSHSNFRTFLTHLGDPQVGDLRDTGTNLAFLPFFHIFGIASASSALFYGTTSVIMNKFNPEQFFANIQTYKISVLFTVPSILQFISKSPLSEIYDLSSLQDVIYGSTPVSKDVIENLLGGKLETPSIRQVYGMTETSGVITVVPKDSVKFGGTVGKAANTVKIKVCDVKTGESLPPNKPGELRVKSGGIMLGYLGNEEATKEAFDEDGFLKTGDLGYFDENGFFYIVGRLKEIIKFKGFQVPPAELEGILMQHPGVLEAGVVGKPDERAGELPTAFVVKNPKIQVTADELIKFIGERVSIQKHLHGGVIFVEKLPRNATAKLMRNELKKMFNEYK